MTKPTCLCFVGAVSQQVKCWQTKCLAAQRNSFCKQYKDKKPSLTAETGTGQGVRHREHDELLHVGPSESRITTVNGSFNLSVTK